MPMSNLMIPANTQFYSTSLTNTSFFSGAKDLNVGGKHLLDCYSVWI